MIPQRKLAETQADAFAGFFSLQAGYKSLNYAKEVLTKLYQNMIYLKSFLDTLHLVKE